MNIATVSLALTMLIASLGVSIANIALPTIAKEFSASFPEVQLIILSYLLAITVMIVIAGKIGDLHGRKKIFLFGTLLFSAAALICALAPTLWVMIAARAIQGIGAAILISLSLALISETVSKEKIGSAMGVMGTMSAVGTASGPTLGGLLVGTFGWRSVFFLMFGLGILIFTIAKTSLLVSSKVNDFDEPEKFDLVGTFFFALAITTFSLSVTLNSGHFRLTNWLLLITSFVAAIIFVSIERVLKLPFLKLELFKNNNLSSNLLMNIIVSTVMMSTLVVGPFYLDRGLGLNSAMVGITMSVGPLLSILMGIPAGKIVDRLGSDQITKRGLLLMILGTGLLVVLPSFWGVFGYIGAVALLSPGYQLFQAANNTSVMNKIEGNNRGLVSGLLSLSRNVGLISGTSIMGSVFAFSTGASQISTASATAIATGMKTTFSVAAFLVFIALLISFFLTNNRREYNE